MDYYSIVFLDSDEADEVLKLIKKSKMKALEYLKDWDYGGESEHCMSTYPFKPWGRSDDTFEHENYVMSWNDGLGYATLTRLGGADQLKTIKLR